MMSVSNVSRETYTLLERYVDLILKWTPKINLISKSSWDDIWVRHIEDSLQIVQSSFAGHWVDLGSGGGLPGLVVAICLRDQDARVTLVESDLRKAAFLRTVAADLDLSVSVVSRRIELIEPLAGDIVSARALAPLPKLLGYVERHLAEGGKALLPKGENWQQEVQIAQEMWSFSLEARPSNNASTGVVLEVGDLVRDQR